MDENRYYLEPVKDWVEGFVVRHVICPFAKPEVERGTIRYTVCQMSDLVGIAQAFMAEIERLDLQSEVSTTIFVIPKGLEEFTAFLAAASLCEKLLEEFEYTGVYQIATFHPQYVFADAESDDPANYTNRSPFPILHLLREESISRALQNYAKPEAIPERNKRFARQLGLSKIRELAAWRSGQDPIDVGFKN